MEACGWSEHRGQFDLWKENRNHFVSFVRNVLIRRATSGDNHILSFSLSSSYDLHIDPSNVVSWIDACLKLNVQHLSINVPFTDLLHLPHSVFTSNIEVLKLCSHSCFARLPESICAAAVITSMELQNVVLPSGDDNGQLILACPLLRHLVLTFCRIKHLKVFTISTPLLETLECVGFCFDETNSCTVRPITPNLKSLVVVEDPYWTCYTFDCSVGDNFSSLLSAEINVNYLHYPLSMEQCSASAYLTKFLPGISNLRSLRLSVAAIKAVTDCPGLMERLPNLFPNLIHLKVINWFIAPGIDAVLNFLERLPHTENLILDRDWSDWGENEDGGKWEANSPFQDIFSCLQTFQFRVMEGSEVELKLLAFLLEKAVLLKKMIIRYHSRLSGKEISKFNEKLLLLPRASSSALISSQSES